MAELFAVAGSTIAIGGVLETKAANFTSSDFASQTWQLIDGWETCGAIGDTSEAITTSLINRGRAIKQKGVKNAGAWENNFANLPEDDGQIDLVAAEATQNNYAFRVVWASGETWYFIGLVMSKNKAGGGANTVDMRNFNIEVNSNIVEVPAA